MTLTDERKEILEMIQRGTISADEGVKLIEALEESWQEDMVIDPALDAVEKRISSDNDNASEDFIGRRKWWVIPFWTGVGTTSLGGALMFWAYSSRGMGIGFFLSWIPFIIGVGLMVLGWNSKTGPWVHIRIQQKPGERPERIIISLPIPIRFVAWIIRTFSHFIPRLEGTGLDEIILALGDKSLDGAPLSINVNDDQEGEQVKIYIG
jgi:hypothetical protein